MLGLGGDDPTRLGPYRLRAVIGDGGMGRVYLATSPGGRAVAVKVIGRGLAAQPNYRERFAREARAAMSVSGLYTASVVDADTTGERPYIATEYVPAPSLADAVKALGPLPLATVSALAGGLAEALAAIHRAGLVHRDVKPHNILLAPDGPVVIDFGIAVADEAQTALTAVGMAVGSPGYIAPEVLSGQEPSPATDMFALGCVLVYAARGVGPFGKGEPLVIAHRTVSQDPDLSGLPEFVRGLAAPLLAREPAARPTPAQLLEHLAIAGGDSVLHDALWLPEDVRAVLGQKRAEVQRLLGGQTAPPTPTPQPPPMQPQPQQPPAPQPVHPQPPITRQPPRPPISQQSFTLPPPRPLAPAPTANHRLRNALLATGGAVLVAGAAATIVLLTQHDQTGPGGHTNSLGATTAPAAVLTHTKAAPTTAPPTTAAADTTTPAPTSASAKASGVLDYKPGTYPVDKLITTDALGYSSVYLTDIRVNPDGSIQADLRYTNDTDSDQQFTCAYDTKDEGTLAIDGGQGVTSSSTTCSDDPSLNKDAVPGGSIPGYQKFPSAPAGSGPWTLSISTVEYVGSVSGISIPTQ